MGIVIGHFQTTRTPYHMSQVQFLFTSVIQRVALQRQDICYYY